VPDGADYNTSKIVYDQTFQANDDVSMNGLIVASNNVKVSGNIVFGDGTVMNTYDNNILSTNPTVFKPSTFTALDICGNLVAGSYATSSDYRIKTNVVELDETYTVDKLRPVKYFQTQINREKYGLIAHELQEHYPDLVIGEKDGSELQRVNYTGLIAILINDIKRLKRELEVLELHQR
jgi:RecJ-like exonuclease